MTNHIDQQQAHPAFAATEFDTPVDFLDVGDAELEHALKTVAWNARDLAQFLRSARSE